VLVEVVRHLLHLSHQTLLYKCLQKVLHGLHRRVLHQSNIFLLREVVEVVVRMVAVVEVLVVIVQAQDSM
jgi:hypothetical protein